MATMTGDSWPKHVAWVSGVLEHVQTRAALERIDQLVAGTGVTDPELLPEVRFGAAYHVFWGEQDNHTPIVENLFGGDNLQFTYRYLARLTAKYVTVELWIAHWIDVYRDRLLAYQSGARLSAEPVDFRMPSPTLGLLGPFVMPGPAVPTGTTLDPLEASKDRYAREQLARTIRTLVEQAGYSTCDQQQLKSVLDWDAIVELVTAEDDLRKGLRSLVGQLEHKINPIGGASELDGATAAADRYELTGAFDRMRLAHTIIAAFAGHPERQYLQEVVAPPANASAAEERVLARSPVAPAQLERLLTALRVNADGTMEVVDPNDAVWRDDLPPATAFGDVAKAAKGALTTYSLFASATAGYAQFVQLLDARGETFTASREKLWRLFDRKVAWPERADLPATRTDVAIGWVGLLLSTRSLVLTAAQLAGKPNLTEDDYVAVFEGITGVLDDVNTVAAAHHALDVDDAAGKLTGTGAVLKTTDKALGVLGVVASCIDYGLSLHKATDPGSGLEAAGHAFAAGGAAIGGITAFASVLGRVPHPMTFAASLLAIGIAQLSKAILHAAAVDETKQLLAMTAFSVDALPRRAARVKKSIMTEIEDEGFEAPWFSFVSGGEEDYARQIGTLLGHMGAFDIVWDISAFNDRAVELNTTRKVKGFTSDGSSPNATLARSVLPTGSVLSLHDATHGREAAAQLGVSGGNLPPELTGAPGAAALTQAAEDVLLQEDEVDVADAGFDLPALVEARLTLPTDAWPQNLAQRIAGTATPAAQFIVRKRD